MLMVNYQNRPDFKTFFTLPCSDHTSLFNAEYSPFNICVSGMFVPEQNANLLSLFPGERVYLLSAPEQ